MVISALLVETGNVELVQFVEGVVEEWFVEDGEQWFGGVGRVRQGIQPVAVPREHNCLQRIDRVGKQVGCFHEHACCIGSGQGRILPQYW